MRKRIWHVRWQDRKAQLFRSAAFTLLKLANRSYQLWNPSYCAAVPSFFFLAERITLCKRIKKQSIRPVVIFCHQGCVKPDVITIVVIVLSDITPKSVPIKLPTPPVSRVPPIMEEAIASISAPSALEALPFMVETTETDTTKSWNRFVWGRTSSLLHLDDWFRIWIWAI